jgi:3-oxoacyl-[acyl-carrier protein] reductase
MRLCFGDFKKTNADADLAERQLYPPARGEFPMLGWWDNSYLRNPTELGVIVTGAGRGIGKRLAIGFANHNAKIGLISRNQTELDATRLEIAHSGGEAFPARADVRIYGEIAAALHGLSRKFQSHGATLEVLVAGAGVQGPIGPFAESDPKSWRETIETNVLGVMNAMRAALPGMIEQRRGKIIVLTGGGSENARLNFAPYAASKTAVARLVETVAEEVRDYNIQINCFAPGGSYTSMTDEILAAGDRAGTTEIERARQVRLTGGVHADKQIQFALFLASEKSNHITGKMLHITDDVRKLEQANMTPELLTLRRLKL